MRKLPKILKCYLSFSNFHENLKIWQNIFIFSLIYLGETLQQPLVINNHNYSANDVEVNDEQDL